MSNQECDHGQLARSCNICHLEQEVTMLRQEYAADTAEIAKLNAMLDEHRGEIAGLKARAEWEKVKPSPPTFMGEPMPPERKARLLEMKAKRGNVSANP